MLYERYNLINELYLNSFAILINSATFCLSARARTFVTRDIKTPDPIPREGQLEALELMETGRLYRYNVKSAEESVVSKCEREIAEYTGHKYW